MSYQQGTGVFQLIADVCNLLYFEHLLMQEGSADNQHVRSISSGSVLWLPPCACTKGPLWASPTAEGKPLAAQRAHKRGPRAGAARRAQRRARQPARLLRVRQRLGPQLQRQPGRRAVPDIPVVSGGCSRALKLHKAEFSLSSTVLAVLNAPQGH